jgi:tetrahydromethanopterin S-methyltransferase subunit D
LVVGVQVMLLVVNVVGNLILIPSSGALGAARMTLVTEVAGTILYGWAVIGASTRHTDDRPADGPRS